MYGLLLTLLLSQAAAVSVNETSVVMVQVMLRHGVRSILNTYPNMKTPASYWDQYGGMGQLTPLGMRQSLEFGQYFRQNYPFLNAVYNRTRVYARSTDFDRTIQTVSAFLAGLYHPSASQVWNSDPKLQGYLPIPVHTEPIQAESIFTTEMSCARRDQLNQEVSKLPEYLQMQIQNKGFVNEILKFTGLKELNYLDMYKIADNALVEIAHNISVDDWVTKKFGNLSLAFDEKLKFQFANTEIARLISGLCLNAVVVNLKNKLNGNANELFVYGTHDTYLLGLQKLLMPHSILKQTSFGAAFIFEMRVDANQNHYVRTVLKNNNYPFEANSLEPVLIEGCNELCPLEAFLKLTSGKALVDFAFECTPKSIN